MSPAPARRINLAFVDSGRRKAPFFLELRRQLEPEFRCLYYSRRVMVRGFVRSAGAPLFPAAWAPAGRYPITDDELQVAIGGKEWVRRGAAQMKKARRLLHELATFYDTQSVDAVVVWNGTNLIVSLATYLARQRGIPVLFAEHGYLPGTTQIDSRGVNFDSSITGLVAGGIAQLAPDADVDRRLDETIAAYKAGAPMRVIDPVTPPHLLTDLRSALYRNVTMRFEGRFHRTLPDVGKDFAELPERFVLLPLQVRKDSQLILHSPIVGNDMPRLLALLHKALADVDPQMRIVVKLHPRERWDLQSRYAELVRAYPDVLFVRRHRVPEILQKAAAVVTVNSTVGFEGILCDKPVVALGRNFYTFPGLVEVVERADGLSTALRRALTQPVDTARRRAFLRYVHERFLAFGSYDDFSERSQGAVADRIRLLLDEALVRPPMIAQAA